MTQRPAVLIMQRHLAPLSAFLESAYDVYRFWEGPPVEAAGDIRALIVAGEFELDKALIERLPNLSLIACFTAGYDGIDVEWCRARGLPVTQAPGVNHEDVADHAIGLILAARRQIAEGDRTIRAGEWKLSTRSITTSLGGQRLGIVGLGHIGEAVARRAEVMRMDIRWWAPREKETAWSRADSLIDLARGELVAEDAVIAARKAGRLGGAALDVFAQEPTEAARWSVVPNTVLTPHTGGATTEAVQGMLILLLQNLSAHFANEPLKTPV